MRLADSFDGCRRRPTWVWLLALAAAALTAGSVAFAGGLGLGGQPARSDQRCEAERATIVGTDHSDRLVGTRRRDVIVAGAGGDAVNGRGGADVICAEDGNDRVSGGAGDDAIRGAGGADRMDGGPGDDVLAGQGKDDVILGGKGDDRVAGELGDDVLRGNAGDDRLTGGPGSDRCVGGGGTDVLRRCESSDGPKVLDVRPPTPNVPSPTPPGPPQTPPGQPQTPPGPPADQPPIAVNDAATVAEDSTSQEVPVLVNDTDPDGGSKAIAAASDPANGTVVITGGGSGLTYAPDADYCNNPPGTTPDTFNYMLNGGSVGAVTVTVDCTDDAPAAVDDNATVGEDSSAGAIDVLANDTDSDGGPKTIASASDPAKGTVVLTGGSPGEHTGLTYEPDPNYCNSHPLGTADTFSYTLNGGSIATVSTTVTCAPEAPVVDTSAGEASYTENDPATPIDPDLSVTDPDPGTTIAGATIQITGGYAGSQDALALASPGSHPGIAPSFSGDTLTLTGDAGVAAYQAALRDVTYRNSSDSPSAAARTVTFTVTDETALIGSDTKGVTVIAVDDPPVAVNDSAAVLEDASATPIPVLTNDTDLDGGPKTINSASDPANGMVGITGGGTGLTYQPDPTYCNNPPGTTPDTFTYTVNGGSSATVSMTVTCGNHPPVADDETFNGNDSAHGNTAMIVNDPSDVAPSLTHPKTTVSGDILAGDTDVDGPGPLTVTPGTLPTNDGGTVTIEADGDFTFNPAASTSCTDGSDFFDYTVEDSGSPERTDTGRVTIAIAGCVWYVSNNASGNSGTASAPFDTLAQAETASGSNHTVFVFDGDGTTTGYASGYALNAGERLIGEHEGLVVDPDQGGALTADTLHPADPGAHPTLTADNEDVIELDDGNQIRGLNVDPQGTGGGIAGAAGDTGGSTIDDVNIADVGAGVTLGSQPGLDLDGTSGTSSISNLTVSTNGATGVRLNNAGTVTFEPGTTISITTAGARGLDATGTNMGTSFFDAITVTGSDEGGVSMLNTTGTTALSDGSGVDLDLTTTSGATPAFSLNNAGTVIVDAGGADNVSATGGPAVDVTGTSEAILLFDDVDSTNSADDGINLAGLGTRPFSASATSTIAGAAGIAFDLDGGSGPVDFNGTITNGEGTTADITGRAGGSVSLDGPITDTGDSDAGQENAIGLSGNTAGTTSMTNATKVLNIGEDHAIVMGSSDGHTLTISGGGLNIDTTAGKGLEATSSGTLNVTGSTNTIDTTTGTSLNVTDTDVGATPLTFQSIAANGASKGIQLSNTGANNALTVQSSGAGTCTHLDQTGCTGGRIRNSTDADDSGATPAGTGIVLNNARGVSLTRMHLHDHSNYGIRGTGVVGFAVANSVVDGANGTDTTFLPDKEGSVRFDALTGTVNVTDTAVSGGANNNVLIQNTSGILNSTFTNLRSGALHNASAEDAMMIEGIGTSTTNATVQSSTLTNAPADLFRYTGDGTGGGALTFTGNAITNNHPAMVTGGVTLAGGANGPTTMTVQNNTMRDSHAAALDIDKRSGSGSLTATIGNNQIGVTGVANSGSLEGNGIDVSSGQGNATYTVTNNTVRQYNSHGMAFFVGTGSAGQAGTVDINLSGNTVQEPGGNPNITLFEGIRVESGMSVTDTFQTCLNIGAGNLITGSSDAPDKDWRVRGFGSTTVRLPTYGGGAQDDAAATSFINSRFGSGANGVASSDGSSAWSGSGTTCP